MCEINYEILDKTLERFEKSILLYSRLYEYKERDYNESRNYELFILPSKKIVDIYDVILDCELCQGYDDDDEKIYTLQITCKWFFQHKIKFSKWFSFDIADITEDVNTLAENALFLNFLKDTKKRIKDVFRYVNFDKCKVVNCENIIGIKGDSFCQQHYDLDITKKIDCCICLNEDAVDEHFITKCGHSFHSHCIKKHLEHNSKCPLCRTVV